MASSPRFQLGLALAVLLAFAPAARAETRITLTGATIHLSDIDPGAPAALSSIELGRAPPPGSSRVLTRREIRQRVREAGADPLRVSVPVAVRVESAAERWTAAELAVRADDAVRAALPEGVSLVKIEARQGVLVPPGTGVAEVRPSIPHGVGRHAVTVVAELRQSDEVVARAPLSLVVDVGPDAFAPLLRKGDRVTLVVEQGNARIGATAVALADGSLGDSIFFRVTSTGKVLKGRVTSRDVCRVVD